MSRRALLTSLTCCKEWVTLVSNTTSVESFPLSFSYSFSDSLSFSPFPSPALHHSASLSISIYLYLYFSISSSLSISVSSSLSPLPRCLYPCVVVSSIDLVSCRSLQYPSLSPWTSPLQPHTITHSTHSHTHSQCLSLVLVVMIKSKELKTKISLTHSLILSPSLSPLQHSSSIDLGSCRSLQSR